MNYSTAGNRPDWVSDEMFPFESRFFATPRGHLMHYVDEGAGDPIVFVHGNPAWSFEFRQLIDELRSEFRCVAPDHIGFGLSSRSHRKDDHHPAVHAATFSALMNNLALEDVTLFLTDWGGPIGLDFARRFPDRVKRIVINNTWCWPVNRDPHFWFFSSMMASPLGQYLIKRRNFFVNGVMPRAVGAKGAISDAAMEHYRRAQPSPAERAANAALPGHIVRATEWLLEIWDERSTFTGKPALVLWGSKDIAFRTKELDRWRAELPDCQVHEFADCGHFLAEEAPERILPLLRDFMQQGC